MSVPDPISEETLEEGSGPGRTLPLPYWVTPHVDVRPQEDGSVAFFFRRSLRPGLALALVLAALCAGLAGLALKLGGHGDGWELVGIALVGAVGGITVSLLRSTGVIAQRGRLLMRTQWLPLVGSERAIAREDIEAIRRHVSLRLGGSSIYQIRAHLRSGEVVPVGHGLSDKVEAASLAAAMERALG